MEWGKLTRDFTNTNATTLIYNRCTSIITKHHGIEIHISLYFLLNSVSMSLPHLWKITVNTYNRKHCDETKQRTQYLSDVTYNNLSQRTTKPTIRRATSEDSDQPAHPRSLIRVFADRICLPQPLGYPKRDERESLPYWGDVQADLNPCWWYISYCRFCRALSPP